MLLAWLSVTACTVAILIPYAFTQVRDATKKRRKWIIEDLKRFFQPECGSTAIPSFEFVKYKYFVDPDAGAAAAGRPSDADERDFAGIEWIIGALPLVLLLSALNMLALAIAAKAAFKLRFDIGVGWLDEHDLPLFAWVALTAYVGGLLYMLRAFNQAINNFDLSPLSFLGATVNLAFGIGLALLLTFSILRIPLELTHPTSETASFPASIAAAFLAGYFPDVALRTVIRAGHLRYLKKEND